MYGAYEGIIEMLCAEGNGDRRPKVIASTATIRGAADQTLSLYARKGSHEEGANLQLFPPPGLTMGDSFFGVYDKTEDGKLRSGRQYVGINAVDYGSILTAQVRAFAAALCYAGSIQGDRDPWWTLLVFYNSLRELGGAKTLFDSDIRSRLKFLQNREGVAEGARRNLRKVEELTSRLSQSEIVDMMDGLSREYAPVSNEAVDACLASSIIELGVDIDRLSLMAVVGQPKTTAQYIQVTGRVGRRWWERPGLILTVYSPGKSRDRSHFEQFHSYHRRLYEHVEPTSATPFAVAAIQRAIAGALIAYARQQSDAPVGSVESYRNAVEKAYQSLVARCSLIQTGSDRARSIAELTRVRDDLIKKWSDNPLEWEEFPPGPDGEYLMLWPGQFASAVQKRRGVVVPSSMRQVDSSSELEITPAYASVAARGTSSPGSANG
jgi:hypothetical protein